MFCSNRECNCEIRYDFRVWGYDTVIQLMKDVCGSVGYPGGQDENVINCNDDGTPPGDLGSKIYGEITQGTYYVMIDGYSTTDVGPFELITTFVNGCIPLCDGNFCGDDQCEGSCGECDEGFACFPDNRCYPQDCQPLCADRECGEDGCGGSCGTCSEGLYCLGVAIVTEDGSIPPSSCEAFEVCDYLNPSCGDDCQAGQICGSDCQCYDSLRELPDLVVLEESLMEETYIHDLDVPETSCTLIEGCVPQPGVRRLLRFTSTILNQGQVDLNFPEPKDRPDLFEYGQCHQHYHFKGFASYTLFAADGETPVLEGRKYAYCMEDTARYHEGEAIGCDKVYDCGFQGIQRGWVDSYGWSLDCSWIDVTDIPPGNYVLQIEVNPSRVFPELSYDNNKAAVTVTIPESSPGSIVVPARVPVSQLVTYVPTTGQANGEDDINEPSDEDNGSSGGSHAPQTIPHWMTSTISSLSIILGPVFAFR